MADTSVEGAVGSTQDFSHGLWGPYWSDVSTGVVIFIDTFAQDDISFARTSDKGANWSTTEIDDGDTQAVAVWYDKETPGNTGTLLHIAWVDAASGGSIFYRTLDISDGSLGTQRTVEGSVGVNSNPSSQRIAITQAVNDNIIVAFSQQGSSDSIQCYKSADNFATAGTDIADVYETASEEDWLLLFPADVDAGDAAAVFWDRSTNAITLKMYDDSEDTWTEFATPIAATAVDDTAHMNMDGSVRLFDNKVLVAWHSDDDAAGDNLETATLTVDSITAPSIAAGANIFTGQAESAQVGMLIDQNTNDVYVAHCKGGTWQATVDVVYHKSTDDMGSWGSEQAYSEAAADDIRLCPGGRTGSTDGGRWQPAFYNDDLTEIFVNEVNDVELGGGGAPATPISSRRLLSRWGR